MKIGRWKTADVFFHHYVQARPQPSTTDKVLGVVLPADFDDDEDIDFSHIAEVPTDSMRDAPTRTYQT